MEAAMDIRIPIAATAAFLLVAGTATAATVKNTGGAEFTIGVDMGNSEKIDKVAAGKSVSLDCPDGCGVTGPWGFSWMVAGDDVISSDGQSLIVVDEKKS
jgi:hypothetical protein